MREVVYVLNDCKAFDKHRLWCDAPKESGVKLEACPSHKTGFTVQTKHFTHWLFLTVISQNTPCLNWVEDKSCGNIYVRSLLIIRTILGVKLFLEPSHLFWQFLLFAICFSIRSWFEARDWMFLMSGGCYIRSCKGDESHSGGAASVNKLTRFYPCHPLNITT